MTSQKPSELFHSSDIVAKTNVQQYTIADIIKWHRDKELRLDPDFQRGSVWSISTRVRFIDTILQKLPIPKVLISIEWDADTLSAIRDVVDGQQRLRAILDFASDKLVMTRTSKLFTGKKYSTLSEEEKQAFLSYQVSVDQIQNANIKDIIEIFTRLNTNTVKLTEPELRHAQFKHSFSTTVDDVANSLVDYWLRYGIFKERQLTRFEHTSFTAELLVLVIHGLQDGGQAKITSWYKRYDKDPLADLISSAEILLSMFDALVDKFDDTLRELPVLASPPHLYVFLAALLHWDGMLIQGASKIALPPRQDDCLTDLEMTYNNLRFLSGQIESPPEEALLKEFADASKRTTQRIASRSVRLPYYYQALLPAEMAQAQ